jgi:hypothetical protein
MSNVEGFLQLLSVQNSSFRLDLVKRVVSDSSEILRTLPGEGVEVRIGEKRRQTHSMRLFVHRCNLFYKSSRSFM